MTKERWELIKEIFESAVKVPPSERDAFLERTCAGDPSLRAEVRSLLSGLEHAESFMDRPAAAALAASGDNALTIRTFQPDDFVSGRFKIVRFIGEGGMGEVYEAEDLEIGTRLALKTLRSEIAFQAQIIARFRQEIQLTRLVTHANVCRTFDVFHHQVPGTASIPAKDVTYFTMELLEGETLSLRLRRGRLSLEETRFLVRQMANALDAAHSVGVIHRDFKPANVILCRPRGSSQEATKVRAVVTDFGLAQSLLSPGNISNALTRSGDVVGTLAYMAPEQLEGNQVTQAVDIYAFGLVIYEMVCGVRPFSTNTGFGDVVRRLKEPPRSPRTLVPDLPERWESVILRCLDIQPDRRFATAGEVADSLENVTGGSQAVGRDQNTIFRRFLGSRSRVFLTAVLLVLLLAWISRSVWVYWNESKPPAPVNLELSQFTSDGGLTFQPSVSADGKIVAFSSDRAGDGILNIWVQYVAGGATAQVTHESYHALEPACSPDGSEIAFRSEHGGGIYVISSFGGNKRLVAKEGHQPQFSPDGKSILFWSGGFTGDTSRPFFRPSGKIYIVPISGGPPRQLQAQFADARFPVWLPDGRHMLFQGAPKASGSVLESSDWWIANLEHPEAAPVKTRAFETLQRKSIVPYVAPPAWSKDTIIFAARQAGPALENENLFQFHVSPNTWQVNGDPVRLTFGSGFDVDAATSRTGELFFASRNVAINIWSLPSRFIGSRPSPENALVQLTFGTSMDARPSISLDGEKLVFARAWGKDRNLWLKNLRTKSESPLTSAAVTAAVISHDGAQVAYSVYERPRRPIEVLAQDATGATRVCNDCGEPIDWSYDGSTILFSLGQQQALGILDLKSGHRTLVSKSGSNLTSGSFSPNDHYMVFTEWIDGDHSKLWLAPMHEHIPAAEHEWFALTGSQFADDKPRFSADGKSIYFQSDRDGFTCLWKLAIDPMKGRTIGDPVPLLHFHRANFPLRELSRVAFDLRVAKDKLVFNVVSHTGNLWRTQLQQ
jgi:serine/threonine protein kinase